MRLKKRSTRVLGGQTHRRIERDRRSAPPALGPIFEGILKLLEDPSLSVEDLGAGGARAAAESFEASLGCAPEVYLRARRMDLAAELLEKTSLPVWSIGAHAGFQSEKGFRRAFKRSHQVPPEEWRRRNSESGARRRPRSAAARGRAWRRLVLVNCEDEEVQPLLERLRAIGGSAAPGDGSPESDPPADQNSEVAIAEAVSRLLGAAPCAEGLASVATWAARLKTPALFELLLRKSRRAARHEPARGVWLAELAMASLKPLAKRMAPEEFRGLMVRGLAWLANGRRKVGDLGAARSDLEKAKALLPSARASADLLVELRCLECQLLICERDLDRALALGDEAVMAAKDLGDPALYARALLARGAAARYAGRFGRAIASFEAAVSSLEDGDDDYLSFVARQNLTVTYLRADMPEDAAGQLAEVKRLAASLEPPPPLHHLEWVDAIVAHRRHDLASAEHHYLAAREGFRESNDSAHLAVISLDVAALYAEMARGAEARAIVQEALPILRALQLAPDTLAALKLLADASAAEEMSLEVLEKVRDQLAAACNALAP